ncbi:MAG: hypothetical protein IPO65_01355 [Saprospiraceae bacterium]|nr:hypothetical protein [Saprospiraceae bacterium]
MKFEIKDEKMEWDENTKTNDFYYFKHEVYINEKKITIADGNLNQNGWIYVFQNIEKSLNMSLEPKIK